VSNAPATPRPTGVAGNWNLTFDDEFNGSSLNASNWSPSWFGTTDPVGGSDESAGYCNTPTVSGGYLNMPLTTTPCSTPADGTMPNSGSIVVSDPNQVSPGFQQAYGFFEARIYVPGNSSGIYDWPAFWTDGQSWPTDGEMDVLEGLSGQACFHFHDPSGGPGNCVSTDMTGWHTFGADWQPGSVTYYYDGQAVGTISTGITSAPMYLILTNTVASGQTATTDNMQVHYVRVWSGTPS
jgi:hypothetical protein